MTVLALLVAFAIIFQTSNCQRHGTIRLYRSSSITSSTGIVRIYYNSDWGNICDDSSFGTSEANVICHQLGYTGVSTYGNTGTVFIYGTDFRSTAIEDVSCVTSSYLALLQCSVASRYTSYCNTDSRDVYVSCYSTRIWSNPYSGQIRLQGGTYSNYGRLEVYCNSQWGTVCDDSFDSTDATVACRQLGYSNAYSYTGNLPGSSSQPIWLDNINCRSSYTCLAFCESCPSSEDHNCNHNEDVVLSCEFSNTFSSPVTSITTTCQYADTAARNIRTIIGVVIGGIIFCIICVIVSIACPICICCCLGIGIGASKGKKKTRVNTGEGGGIAVPSESPPAYTQSQATPPYLTSSQPAAAAPYTAQATSPYHTSSQPVTYQPAPYPSTGYPSADGYPPQDGGYPTVPAQGGYLVPPGPGGYPAAPPSGYPILPPIT